MVFAWHWFRVFIKQKAENAIRFASPAYRFSINFFADQHGDGNDLCRIAERSCSGVTHSLPFDWDRFVCSNAHKSHKGEKDY